MAVTSAEKTNKNVEKPKWLIYMLLGDANSGRDNIFKEIIAKYP